MIIKFYIYRVLVFLFMLSAVYILNACHDDFGDIIDEENHILKNNNIEEETEPDEAWEKIAYVTTPRAGAAAVIYDDWLYIYGGEDDLGIKGDFWRYRLSTGDYEMLAPDEELAYSALVEAGGYIFRFGGIDAAGIETQSFKYYNIARNTWTGISTRDTNGSWPSHRHSHIMLAYNDPDTGERNIYIHGGFDSAGNVEGALHELADVDLITDGDVNTKSGWSEKNFDCITGAHSATIYDEAIYIFGGYDRNTSTYKNALYKYDITGDSYIMLTPVTVISARSSMQMISSDSGLYVYGGRNSSKCLADVWFYSFSQNRWNETGTGPGKRCSYNAMKDGDDLLVYAGYYEDQGAKVYNSELWRFPVSE